MVPRWLRAAYYGLLSPAMRLNSARHRAIPLVLRRPRRAHHGPETTGRIGQVLF